MTSEPVRQACILVGGKGIRLGDLTRQLPKPLIEIGENIAFIDVLIGQIARQGFNDVVLLAGYLGELVRARYEGKRFGSARVRVLVEQEPRGTGGALVGAREIIAPQFLLLNGDTFFDINLRALTVAGKADQEALIALHRISDAQRFGSVVLEGDRVLRFHEKGQGGGSALISAGAYLLRASLIDRIRFFPCSLETDIFPVLAKEGRLCGRICEGYFIDIGLLETLQQARRELGALTRRPAVFLDRDCIIGTDDNGRMHRPDQAKWVPHAKESVRRLNDLGYRVVVVTRQSGVGEGYDEEEIFRAFDAWMQDQLAAQGAFIDAFYFCPNHSQARVEEFTRETFDCTPQVGTVFRALAELHIDQQRSFLIGDKQIEVEAARRAGMQGFVFSGGNLDAFLGECLASFGAGLKDIA